MLVKSQEKCFSFQPDVFTRRVQSLPSGSKSEFQISEQVKLLFPLYSCICLFCGVVTVWNFWLTYWSSSFYYTDFCGHPQHLSGFLIVHGESTKIFTWFKIKVWGQLRNSVRLINIYEVTSTAKLPPLNGRNSGSHSGNCECVHSKCGLKSELRACFA